MVFRLRVLAIIRLIFEGAETYFLLIKYRNIEGARAPPAPPLTPSLRYSYTILDYALFIILKI